MLQTIMQQKNKLHLWRCWGVSSSAYEFGVTGDIIRPIQVLVTVPWWLSGKEFACQCTRREFDPSVRKAPWRREYQPTPVFLPGEFHGERRLVGCSPWDHRELVTTKRPSVPAPHFRIKKKEAQRRESSCPRSHSVEV